MQLLCHAGRDRISSQELLPANIFAKCVWGLGCLFSLALTLCVHTCVCAQTPAQVPQRTSASTAQAPQAAQAPSAAGDIEVNVGVSGVWKIGHATPVRITLPSALAAEAASLEVSTFDGDGVEVTYHRQLAGAAASAASPNEGAQTLWCDVTIGRSDRPLTVRLIDKAGQPLAQRQIEGDALGKALPPTQPWIVAVGSSLGVEASSHILANSSLPSFTTTVVEHARDLPEAWRGLAGCDVLIIATAGSQPLVSHLSAQQWQAIEDWIGHGGSAVISLGDYATELASDAPLRSLLPGEIVERLANIRTSPLEASTTTTVQLAPISAIRLTNVRGVTELAMLDNSSKRFSWWVRYSIGKGVVNYLGSDLDSPTLREWKDRRLIWDKLLATLWNHDQQADPNSERNVSGTQYLGYDDVVGQLRATLDYFPTARISSFGEVTLILVIILMIIGPLDYWISVRWLQRPEFSWIVLASTLLLSSAGLIWLERASRPEQLLMNSAHIVDFLPEERLAVVDAWTHVYSSHARKIDVGLQTAGAAFDARLDWQGLPGKGLGGLESNLLSDQGMPGYAIDVTAAASASAAAITGVGIPTSGTKCFFANWSREFQPLAESDLRELKGIDQIEGLLVNPLEQDILRPLLMYHNWVYQLPSRLRAGEELTLTYEMVPKDLLRRLNRRQIINSNDTITPWIPEDRQSLDRLLELMMFYKAGGGADYMRLQHRFLPRIDISNSLALDHAVLFGQLATPLGEVVIENVSQDEVKLETHSTWCRVLLPVARGKE